MIRKGHIISKLQKILCSNIHGNCKFEKKKCNYPDLRSSKNSKQKKRTTKIIRSRQIIIKLLNKTEREKILKVGGDRGKKHTIHRGEIYK